MVYSGKQSDKFIRALWRARFPDVLPVSPFFPEQDPLKKGESCKHTDNAQLEPCEPVTW